MDHSLPLLFTLALAFVLALIFGCIAEKLKCPALVGFLCAGILCSSHTPGPTADMEIAMQLSEVGVILLMFGVGLHFSISDLLKVKGIAVPGAVLQMTIATLLGLLFAVYVWEWSLSSALIFGLCLSCASTVVLLKALEMHGHLNTVDGQISVGWLVVEDIATVLILVLLPPVAQIMGVTPGGGEAAEPMTASGIAYVIASTLLHVVAFIAIMMVVGRKFIPWVLWQIAKTGSRELFTLSILTASVGIAYGAAAVFDVSFALGAFFAGMVMRESKYAHRAATDSLPLQDAFSVLFFVGVGMMLDWRVILEEPWSILTMLAIIMIGKSLTAFCLVHFLRYPLHTSLNVGAALAQIGEFSFILAAQGIALGMTDQKMLSMVVASAILSIALNPLMFAMIPYVRRFSVRYFAWARAAAMLTDPYSVLPKETSRRMLMGQTILVGSGSVTRSVAKRLATDDVPFVCISEDKSFAEELREQKHAVISGDAADPMVLVQGHIVTAAQLMVIDIDPVKTLKIVEMAKQLNPELNIMARAGSRDEVEHFKQEGIANVYLDSESVSEVLTGNILDYYKNKKDEEQDGQDKARTQFAH